MKNIFILFGCFIFLCTACEEKTEPVDLFMGTGVIDTVDQNAKKVLIEEFTGVRCVNCPEGSEKIETLLAIHGKRLVAVSIHAGFFASAFGEEEEFNIPEGDELLSLMGGEGSFPAACINRKIFEGESNQQSGQTAWSGYIEQELALPPSITLNIENTFDETSRQLGVKVSGDAAENISDALYLSVLITENNIVASQVTPSGTQADYTHKHVFRSILTNTTGDELAVNGLSKDETFEKNYSFTLPDHWVVENCKVIALVHLIGDKTDVLQVDEVGIIE